MKKLYKIIYSWATGRQTIYVYAFSPISALNNSSVEVDEDFKDYVTDIKIEELESQDKILNP